MRELAGLGATVHTCARNKAELEKCLRDWEEEGFRVSGSVCDVSLRDRREELVDTVSSAFNGILNILVGLFIRFPIRHCWLEFYARKMDKPRIQL